MTQEKGTFEKGNDKIQPISLDQLRALITTLGFVERVRIGYIKLNNEIEPMDARIVTENSSEVGQGSGIFVETGVGSPQFLRRDRIAYIHAL